MASAATSDGCSGSPTRPCGYGRSGCPGEIDEAPSDGPASTKSCDNILCLESGSQIHTPPRANLCREEPDAGNPHVRVCEEWGRQRPHLLGHLVPSFDSGNDFIGILGPAEGSR